LNDASLVAHIAAPAGRATDPPSREALRPPTVVVPIAVALGALTLAAFPPGVEAVIEAFVVGVLVVLAAIDIEHGIIPNRIVLPAFGLVLLAQLAFYPQHALEWLLSALLAAVALLLPRIVRSSWMGMGDVKLMLLIGAALGWQVAGALMLAFLCVFPVALVVVLRGGLAARKTAIPFGPFLALGAVIVLLSSHL
jgi:leader peptidase (prepilin peptidase) / N-methyltransferase